MPLARAGKPLNPAGMPGSPAYRFGPFTLDPADRRLFRDGEPVEVSARYLDALILLAAESGRLVTKDRFMDEVWRGVPVTDEALTQCIRSLRKALGDDAGAPRYIQTVPRHGYRLIAAVEDSTEGAIQTVPRAPLAPLGFEAGAGALGGGFAGIAAALAYLAVGLVAPGIGTASTLLVLISVNLLLGLGAGLAVAGGAVLAERYAGPAMWKIAAGGAAGGLLVGAIGGMLSRDLFALFFGRDPGAVTGAFEGLALGAATGLAIAFSLSSVNAPAARRLLPGFVLGGMAGTAIALAGGRLMAGSLAELVARFPESNLRLGGALFGEQGLGPVALTVATAFECALFAGCVAGAIVLARRLGAAG